MLTRYANGRLLFRLASSRHAQAFVLKGAALFTIWTGKPHRATRDVDLLGFGDPGIESVRAVFAEVLAVHVSDDGVRYDLGSLTVDLIREEQEYGGVRVELVARIAAAKVPLQVDVGFGDAITPEARLVEFLPLLDFPAPRMRAYPPETVVAEKLEAIVKLGLANTRMKDFYDIAVLARDFDFDGALLSRALANGSDTRPEPNPRAAACATCRPRARAGDDGLAACVPPSASALELLELERAREWAPGGARALERGGPHRWPR